VTAHEPTSGRERTGLLAALGRLWFCGLFAAVLFGAYDVVAHAPALRWWEAGEVVGIYALLGGLGTLAGIPLAALLLWLLRPLLGLGRAAAALLGAGLAAAILAAVEQGALGRPLGLAALLAAALLAARASALRTFERVGRWRVRRGLALAALAGLAVAPVVGRRLARCGAGELASRAGGSPDLVLIVLDTQRADHLGAYGDPRGLSPAFDAFAREGALFNSCFSPAPWTVPSHASMFTGHFPPSHGCSFEHHRWLDHDFTTLAEALQARGYQTAAFVANEYLFESNLLQGFEVAEPAGASCARLAIRPLLELIGWPARYADHGATDALERVDAFLARERDPERPLLLFVNLLETHWRYLPPLADRLDRTRPQPGVAAATGVSRRFYGPLVMAGKRIDGPVEASIRALYAAAVRYQDRRLGELLEVLRRRLDWDRAAVAVTSDHGENLGEGGRYDHVFAVNDALVHVPLAVRYPPAFPAGSRVEGLCQLVDLPVTLFALSSRDGAATLGEGLAGRSLLPGKFEPRDVVLLFGDPYLGHLGAMELFAGFNRDVLGFAAVLRGVSDGWHKLVRSSAKGEELFDLAADRDETRDLSASDSARRDALRARLDEELKKLPAYVGPPQQPPRDPEVGPLDDERLRAMGYVHGGRR
jgi:arylsulfatase A-like enzyme